MPRFLQNTSRTVQLWQCLFIAVAAVSGFVGIAGATPPLKDDRLLAGNAPLLLYGDQLLFDVYRKGVRIGRHQVQFRETTDGLKVLSDFQIDIRFLGITAYRYRYDSQSLWQDGRLAELRASVDDDGKVSHVEARRLGHRYAISTAEGSVETAAPLMPTDHWNPGVLQQTRVLNTLTGRINDVRIVREGRDRIETERGPVNATRYAYTGDIQANVWYDDAGRWVKLRFLGTDGSTIDYACRRCQGGQVESALR